MNFLKKGPEIKLSELKIPDFLYDLYYDLKERHLLPLAAVLAVSLVVVPIALSRTTGSTPPEETPIATPSTAAGKASSLVVAKSAPGLRDYRQRLRDAHALNPFRKQANAAAAAASSAASEPEGGVISEGSTAPAVSETPSESVEAPVQSSPSSSFPSESGGGSSTSFGTATKYASNTLDVRIVTVPPAAANVARSSAKPPPKVRRELPELTMLPSRGTPVAIFMGTTSDAKKALLLVSSDVQSLFGDGQCIIGSQSCQLLALEKGVPETFVYGPQARTYRIEVLRIDKTLTSKPRKASLGKPKGKKKTAGRETAEGAAPEAPESTGRISSAQPR
jgi:hypothetical protein